MLLWIILPASLIIVVLNFRWASKLDDAIEKYSQDVIKLIREDDLDISVPKQIPLNHHQKLALIREIRQLPNYESNETILKNEIIYRKLERLRNWLGLTVVGVVFIPLALKKWLF